MLQPKSKDYLNFATDKEVQGILFNERVLFSDKVHKRNDYGFFQDRNFLITNKGIYNLKKKKLKRRISLDTLLGVTISSASEEFIIHGFDCEYDYHFKSPRRKEIIDIMAQTYRKNTGLVLKFVNIDVKHLKAFVTQKKEKQLNPEFSRMNLTKLSSINVFLYGVDKNFDEILQKGIENMYRTDIGKAKVCGAKELKLEHFRITKAIGLIGFGKVLIAEYSPSKEYYLLKEFPKKNLIQKGKIKEFKEKAITQRSDCAFINRLLRLFQTEENVYFVSPYLGGLALREHIRRLRLFDEEKAKFYSAQVALAIDYLHRQGVVHRNLNPQTIWMDIDGYIKVIDFSYCVELMGKEQAFKFSYKDEYCAPEIIKKEGHDHRADWWSFGVILYEMLCGSTPFLCDDIDETSQQIISGELHFTSKVKISPNAMNIIEKLLCKDREQRLGSTNGFEEIRLHPFFASVNLDQLITRKATVPYFTLPGDILEGEPGDEDIDLDIDENKENDSKKETINADAMANHKMLFDRLVGDFDQIEKE